MTSLKLNGKIYNVSELDFNKICDLEQMGADLFNVRSNVMSTMRAFVALVVGDADLAGQEIQEHIANGGDFTDIATALSDALAESSFFQQMQANKQKDTKKKA